jgi:drug/metabolite transporter (DMT)-like permease
MPIWAVILARLILQEPITLPAMARIAIAFVGALLILLPEGKPLAQSLPVPANLAEWLGLAGGISLHSTM